MNPLLSMGIDKIAPNSMKNSINIDSMDEDFIETSFKDFLSNLLSNEDTKKAKASFGKKESIDRAKNNQEINLLSKNETKKDLPTLEEVLNLVIFLKSNGLSGNFPTDLKTLDSIVADKQALKEFKEVKNLQELFKVAQKYDIKIEKFEFSKIEDKNIKVKINKVLKEFSIKQNHPLKKEIVSSEEVLTNILEKKSIKREKTPPKDRSILSSILKRKDTQAIKKNILNSHINHINKDVDILPKSPSKILVLNKDKKSTSKIENMQLKALPKSKLQIDQTFEKLSLNTDKKEMLFTTLKKHSTPLRSTIYVSKENQEKRVDLNDSNPLIKPSYKNISQSINIDNSHTNSSLKSSQIQHTINSFTNDLKEQIESFKPPIMRVKMRLNPKDLGSVDVSIVSRGNNLQVNINANNNTMAIFTQNQAEFKNSLVNMGFTNLNMNFNTNSNSQNHQRNRSQKGQESDIELVETVENEDKKIQSITLTLPKYT